MASQMADAQLTFQNVTITAGPADFKTSGKRIDFAGFFRAYVEGSDDPEAALDDQEDMLPPLEEQEKLNCTKLDPDRHETKPPARFTEASLVQELDAKGIGRPSTYASIISTIQDRGYVRKEGNQLIPTFTAMAVIRLLEQNFPQLVDLNFTAAMEQSLDDISNGQAHRLPYLERFYAGDQGLSQVVKQKEEGIDPRQACTLNLTSCTTPIRLGRKGAFIQIEKDGEAVNASLPDGISPADVTEKLAQELIARSLAGPRNLGIHTEYNLPILVKVGPFGPYLQIGEVTEETPKPKRVSIPKNISPEEISLETALKLMELPRNLGQHPEDKKVVKAGIGPYGPYVVHNGKFKSLGKEQSVLTIELPEAVELLKQVKPRGGSALREIGAHPADGKPISIMEGRYGPYIKHDTINATLPKETEINNVTMEEALKLLAEKEAQGGGKKAGRKKAATKATAKKSTTKKKAVGKKAEGESPTKKSVTKKATKKTKKKS
jgi:DNA topoisomerase-1